MTSEIGVDLNKIQSGEIYGLKKAFWSGAMFALENLRVKRNLIIGGRNGKDNDSPKGS